MTTLLAPTTAAADVATPDASRVRLREPATSAGFVDGAWWPRSNDLAAEIGPLFEALWKTGRDLTRMTFNLDAWTVPPRRMVIAGRLVHLGGYHFQNRSMVSVFGSYHRDKLDLLLIAPDSDPAVAARMLELAGDPNGTSRPERIIELATA